MSAWLSIALGIFLFIIFTAIVISIGLALLLPIFSPMPPPRSSASTMLFWATVTSAFWGVIGSLWLLLPASLIFQWDFGEIFQKGVFLFAAPILLIQIVRIGKATTCPNCHVAFQSIFVRQKQGYFAREISPRATDEIYRSIIEYRCDNCQHTWVVDESKTYKDADM